MTLGCLHVNAGEEFKRFLRENLQKTDLQAGRPPRNGSEILAALRGTRGFESVLVDLQGPDL
jgi:hypothetical protein